jgi:hypothetical protein
MIRCLLLSLTLALLCHPASGDEPVPTDPPLRWWKGNLHTHSLWSDGDDFPEMIGEWYRTHGYHFLALSDHNILAEGPKWMPHAAIVKRGGQDALAKYRARFGGDWVETRGSEGSEEYAVRLKPLSEYRALLEERGRFLMIQSEEISDKAEGLPVHLNATNIQELIQPLGGMTVRETITANVRAVQDQAERKGREILVHLNHPNFGLAITAEDLAEVVAERYFEVYNGHPGVKHLGDEHHPSVERLWDIANTIRIGQLKSPPLMGLATDDSHDYHGQEGSHPGRGWVMVESRYLTPEHLIRAMKAGRFYASSGVGLKAFGYDAGSQEYKLDIAAAEGAEYTTQFIGTEIDADTTSQPPGKDKEGRPIRASRKYSGEVGKVLATIKGAKPSYKLTGKELYVRATVTSNKAVRDPVFQGQLQQAWVQPVGWEGLVEAATPASGAEKGP